jgi:hypothetical protein
VSIDAARAVADAVLYEGYLLHPYRASEAKNRSRWQFGVLGPPLASESAFGEPPTMSMQCLLTPGGHVTVHLRFLHLQVRDVERLESGGSDNHVPSLRIGDRTLLSWDEAVEHEVTVPPFVTDFPVHVPAFSDFTPLHSAHSPSDPPAGRFVRRRWPLTARVGLSFSPLRLPGGPLTRLTVTVSNEHPSPVADKQSAARHSLLGAHLLIEAHGCSFVSVQDPPPFAAEAAADCTQNRCWPVLAGPPGTADVLLGAPIILYDHPRPAAESPGELFDLTEIDEILALRVLTMTDAEKAEARATDPRAAAVIDRCDALSRPEWERLHGARRDPPAVDDVPWWVPAVDGSVDPMRDTVDVGGVTIGRDSRVVLRPARRADAQDLFLDGRLAKVTAVVADVDGRTHVAVALVDDPNADLHEWYGRYYYFAPDEIEPATEGEDRS